MNGDVATAKNPSMRRTILISILTIDTTICLMWVKTSAWQTYVGHCIVTMWWILSYRRLNAILQLLQGIAICVRVLLMVVFQSVEVLQQVVFMNSSCANSVMPTLALEAGSPSQEGARSGQVYSTSVFPYWLWCCCHFSTSLFICTRGDWEGVAKIFGASLKVDGRKNLLSWCGLSFLPLLYPVSFFLWRECFSNHWNQVCHGHIVFCISGIWREFQCKNEKKIQELQTNYQKIWFTWRESLFSIQ